MVEVGVGLGYTPRYFFCGRFVHHDDLFCGRFVNHDRFFVGGLYTTTYFCGRVVRYTAVVFLWESCTAIMFLGVGLYTALFFRAFHGSSPDHDPIRGSGQEFVKSSRVGSVRVGSGWVRRVSNSNGSGQVGSPLPDPTQPDPDPQGLTRIVNHPAIFVGKWYTAIFLWEDCTPRSVCGKVVHHEIVLWDSLAVVVVVMVVGGGEGVGVISV